MRSICKRLGLQWCKYKRLTQCGQEGDRGVSRGVFIPSRNRERRSTLLLRSYTLLEKLARLLGQKWHRPGPWGVRSCGEVTQKVEGRADKYRSINLSCLVV